eukprot:9468606-Alexandrium_andersonii.AAC.1
MAAKARKQRSGWRSRCSEESRSSPGALWRACLNFRRKAAGRRGRRASSGTERRPSLATGKR